MMLTGGLADVGVDLQHRPRESSDELGCLAVWDAVGTFTMADT
jgi:hypothetical protein